MQTIHSSRVVGVCSWSLQPSNINDLIRAVEASGLSAIQLALNPLVDGTWPIDQAAGALQAAGIEVRSGMLGFAGEDYTTLESIRLTGGVRPDAAWPANLSRARATAQLATALDLRLVTFHAGFIPHDSRAPGFNVMIDRLDAVAEAFDRQGIQLGLETGQETAGSLLAVLGRLQHKNVGVNFDPANMILYGMGDPVAALRVLAPHIVQIHIKDAIPTTVSSTWGSEVAVGFGSVDWPAFLTTVQQLCPQCDWIIEREAGSQRVDDIRTAHVHLRRLSESGGRS